MAAHGWTSTDADGRARVVTVRRRVMETSVILVAIAVFPRSQLHFGVVLLCGSSNGRVEMSWSMEMLECYIRHTVEAL
jgi:hypothetical protein